MVLSSLALILKRKRELVALLYFLSSCLEAVVNVLWFFHPVSLIGLQCVSLVLYGHTHLSRHKNSNNGVCTTGKGSDQSAHTRILIRAYASRLNILGLLSYWPNII